MHKQEVKVMSFLNQFSGKRILITGAASGIGRDLGMVLKNTKLKLALTDIQLLAKEDFEGDAEVLIFKSDVTSQLEMEKIRDHIFQAWGGVDIVVAAAGVGGINPGYCFSSDLDQKIMSINYFGTINTFVPFIEQMKKNQSGHLVGVCSLAALRGLPQAASYSASKAAQMTWLESVRLDLKEYNILVTSIHPGFVATPMANHKEFDMPFTVPVRKSSMLILKAIVKKKKQYFYPWAMAFLSQINRLLPNCIYDFLMPRLNPKRAKKARLLSALSKE